MRQLSSSTSDPQAAPRPGEATASASSTTRLSRPILTPRFAIWHRRHAHGAISALLSRDPTLRVQTHLSENEARSTFTKHSSLCQELQPRSMTTIRSSGPAPSWRTRCISTLRNLPSSRSASVACRIATSNLNLCARVLLVSERCSTWASRWVSVRTYQADSGWACCRHSGSERCAKVLAFQRAQAESKAKEEHDGTLRHPLPPTSEQAHSSATTPRPAPPSTAATRPARRRPVPAAQTPHSIATSSLNTTEVSQSAADPALVPHTKVTNRLHQGPLSIATLFYLATLGGAEVCAMASRIGSLEVGKEFDALLVQTTSHWGSRGVTGNPGCFVERTIRCRTVFESGCLRAMIGILARCL